MIMEFTNDFRGRAVACRVSERAEEIYQQQKKVLDDKYMSTMTEEQKEVYKAKIYSYNKIIQGESWNEACRELSEGKLKISDLYAIRHELRCRILNVRIHKIMEDLRKANEMHKGKQA